MTLSRRQLVKCVTALCLASISGSFVHASAQSIRSVKLPKRLQPGNTIGLVAPASNSEENETIHFAIDVIRSLGFKVKIAPHLFERDHYLAGSDQQRASDINLFFADPEVDALFCLRGGYGSARILPYLDYDTISANPKILLGYSDITALLNAIHKKAALVCYHGPIAQQNFTDYTLAEFKKVLMYPQTPMQIAQTPPCVQCREGFVERENRLTTIQGGVAKGHLIGGNLSTLITLIGTSFEPDFNGALLFLEDIDESPYRIDRMLTQLLLSGALAKCAGIVLGKFTDAESEGNSFSVEAVLFDRLKPLKIPTVRGLMIGHVDDQATLPIGVYAELDADNQQLTLLEPSVA